MSKELFLIVDGNSLMHRAFHALPVSMAHNGTPTNALHGFLMMLLKVIETEKPTYVAVAFDEHSPTFRHTMYDAYKAGRQKTAEELVLQLSLIRTILKDLGITVLSLTGYEADDILGTISALCTKKDIHTLLLTGDKDALQLINEHVHLLFTRKGISESVLFTPQNVKEHFGFSVDQVTDYKGLVGDTSDNIKGIKGVGDKTGLKLLDEYHTLENVLDHADEIKGKLGENIRTHKEDARFSKKLATIVLNAPIDIEFNVLHLSDSQKLLALSTLNAYGLKGVVQRFVAVFDVKKDIQENAQTAILTQNTPQNAPTQPQDPLKAPLKNMDCTLLQTKEEIEQYLLDTQNQPTALYVQEEGISLATDHTHAKIQLVYDLMTSSMGEDEVFATLSPLFDRKVYTHNIKALLHILDTYHIAPPKIYFDCMLAEYLLNPDKGHFELENMCEQNAFALLQYAKMQEKLLKEYNMLSLLFDIEIPLSYVLFDMEKAGFLVDKEVLFKLQKEYEEKLQTLQTDIYATAGESDFNINSPKQLGVVLFEHLQLPVGKKTKSGYSTDAETLENLMDAHPIVPLLLEYRQYKKFLSTYVEALLQKGDQKGRIHSFFDQTGTATGRISSSEPNLQNIPVRSALGKEIRRAFVAKEGCVLVDADYSQIELRLLAHMSQDKIMIDAFNHQEDIHTRTAAYVYNVPLEQVTSEMRSSAKAVNFGIVYGISAFGLSRNLNMPRKEASILIDTYFERYPSIQHFMEDCKQSARKNGFAHTLFHRRRYLPQINNANANIRGFQERVAMNMPVQGTAADIIKLAMIKTHQALKENYPNAHLILQVHDELIIETEEKDKQNITALLKQKMEEVLSLSVPLLAEIQTGKSWYESKWASHTSWGWQGALQVEKATCPACFKKQVRASLMLTKSLVI